MIHLTLNKLLRIYKTLSPFCRPSERLSNTPKATQPTQSEGIKVWALKAGGLAGGRTEPECRSPNPKARIRQHQQGMFGSDGARTRGEEPRERV